MKTTITEYRKTICPRCFGRGYLPQFQHRKGGECFACGATGHGQPQPYERPMTDDEVIAALAEHGFTIIETTRAETGNWLVDLFGTPEEQAEHAETMKGARILLAAI